MRQILTPLVAAALLFSGTAGTAGAQHSRARAKSLNAYRQSYQRMGYGAGSETVFEIRSGYLWGWGQNNYGQLGDGTTVNRTSPVQIGTDNKWMAVSSSMVHTAAIKSDGTLWTWGRNAHGQLGDGTWTNKSTPTQVGSDNKWVSIACGVDHTLALKSDGTLWAWGAGSSGQLGDGTTINKNTPVQVGSDTKWVRIACGYSHSLGLKSDGTLWAWGYNNSGQIGDNTLVNKTSPTQIGSDTKWTGISGGQLHSAAVKSDGTLWVWGENGWYQLGDGGTTDKLVPTQVGSDTKWVEVACQDLATNALKSDGTLWGWGTNAWGNSNGASTPSWVTTPAQVGSDTKWVSLVAGSGSLVALKSDGSLWSWGRNFSGNVGNGTTTHQNTPYQARSSRNDWIMTAAGATHNVALKADGTLWAWGTNGSGQLGDGSTTDRSEAVQIGSDTKWAAVTSGGTHTHGIKSDGTLWAWGNGANGRLGDGTTTSKSAPVQIGSDTKWTGVSAGLAHALALKSDGTLWAWGRNDNGRVGDGTSTDQSAPVQIGSDTKWTSVSAGSLHSLGLKSDGTLWAWGANASGQLGDGTTVNRNTPTQIGSDNKWVAIAAANNHSIALKSDGTVWSWGDNTYGQLGDGTTTSQTAPVQVGTDTKWISIAAGADNTFGRKSDGSVWSWGRNTYGQLGIGNTIDQSSPTCISGHSNVVSIGQMSGATHSAIIKISRDKICAAGDNSGYQLGNGTTTASTSFNCDNSLCRIGAIATAASTTVSSYPLGGTGTATDVKSACDLLASVTPSGAAPATGNIASVVINDATVQSHSGQAYVQRHYELTPATNPNTATATITLYYTQAEFTAYNAANGTAPDLPTGPADATGIANLRITQCHGTPMGGYAPSNYPSTWGGSGPARVVLTPSSTTWNPDENRWEVTVSVTGFSGFFAHGNIMAPLPIKLESFQARALHAKDVLLSWSVTGNTMGERYTVERSSDGKTFYSIGALAAGNAKEYSLHDTQPLEGKSYYRLRVTEGGGQVSFSEVRSVSINGVGSYTSVYPSPAKNYIVIETNTAGASATLADVYGRPVMNFGVESGRQVSIAALPAGMYMLKLSDGSSFRVVKE